MIEFPKLGNRTSILFRDGGSRRGLRAVTMNAFREFAPRVWELLRDRKTRIAFVLIPNLVRRRDPFVVGVLPARNRAAAFN